MAKPRKPIQPTLRGVKFFTGTDFNLESELGKEYFTDLNHSVKIYKIDYKKTKTHKLYGESRASEKVVSEPVVINCRATIEKNETKLMAGVGLKKEIGGNLIFTTYNSELETKGIDIRMGDYVGYTDPSTSTERYYEVTSNNKLNNANEYTHLGTKSYWRKIVCTPVDQDIFSG